MKTTPRLRRLAALTLALVASAGAAGDDLFWVATSGDDANPGTEAEPWRTIQHAADVATPDSIVTIRGGTYSERVSINVSGTSSFERILFRSAPGETAVIDGGSLDVPAGWGALLEIADRSFVDVQGLVVRGWRSDEPGRVPIGILVRGAVEDVSIVGCTVEEVRARQAPGLDRDAHGIAVYGTSAKASVRGVVIEGCTVRFCELGSSEAIVMNGNVELFRVTNCDVHDVDNIGIDVIGGEGTCPDPGLDVARNGLVARNRVRDVDSLDNPAYGGERSAAGIYVDGGRDVAIDRNEVWSCNFGIEIASEHAGSAAERIVVTNNVARHCHGPGLVLGGYDETVGGAWECVIVNNTFHKNDIDETGSGEWMIQHDVVDATLRNNIVRSREAGILVTNPFATGSGTTIDDNLYFAPNGTPTSQWEWQGVSYTGFSAWRNNTGHDGDSSFGDPLFENAGFDADLRLRPGSPAIDAGADGAVPGGVVVDLDGNPRIAGARVDRGAYETQVGPPCFGDVDGDGTVGFSDLLVVLQQWGPCGGCPGDLDDDGAVGFLDLLVVLGYWGDC